MSLELENTQTESKQSTWRDAAVTFALIAILILGATVRLVGVNWDEDQHLHPDERFLTMVESALQIPGTNLPFPPPPNCSKWGGYFDTKCSPLNPANWNFGFFVYGTFPIFLTRVAAGGLEATGYGEVHLVGRILSALFDLSTVLIIFFIGRRLYDTRVALLGAFFLALAALDIQQSHFFTVDTFTNVPILLAFWFAMDMADGRGIRAFVLAGVMFGLALAGRINIAPFAAVLVAAAVLGAWKQTRGGEHVTSGEIDVPPESYHTTRITQYLSPRILAVTFGSLIALGLATIIVFRIFQPYAANGAYFLSPRLPEFDLRGGAVGIGLESILWWAGGANDKFIDNMLSINGFITGAVDFPPNHQWTNRPAYIFPLENMIEWGLGLPLGIAAWLGFALAAYRLVFKREWKHLLIVLWIGVTFVITGAQFAKTIRYFLPLYPFLALLGGYLLVELWDYASRLTPHASRLTQYAIRIPVALIALFVIAGTLFYGVAFTTIYTRPVTRVDASRWMLDNIAPGMVIGNEHWDDPLPLRIDGKDPFGGYYRGIELHWYDEDTPDKRAQAISWLDQAEYLVLSSNRLYASIPRLPMRYPMTTLYYKSLFDGTLGFDLVKTFTSRPQLFGIEFNDDDAEESFTVYDHPKVLIFKKSSRYSHENTTALFNRVDLSEVYRFLPREAAQAPTGLLLKPADREAQAAGGTWRDIFNPDDFINRVLVLGWLVMIELLGWLTFPLAFVVFRALADRGYIFAKALGILLPAWGAWFLASYHVLPFSRASILAMIALLLAVNALIVWRCGRDLRAFFKSNRFVLFVEELLFLVFFGAFLLIRFGNPDLWHPNFGGEKPMDFALLNAINKSTWFPPYDPWFAGGYLNYYYFGQLITATLLRLSGIVPEVGYNLALPMYFALLAMGAFSVAFNLVKRGVPSFPLFPSVPSAPAGNEGNDGNYGSLLIGLLGAIFVAVIGNLAQIILVIQNFARVGGAEPNDAPMEILASALAGISRVVIERVPFEVTTHHWYWNASRVIPDTINEFPFFSFVYADLHAHLMALPFTLLAIGLAANFVLRSREDALGVALDVLEVIVAGLALGALRAINFADFPTYALLFAAAIAIGEYARRQRIDLAGIIATGWRIGGIVVLATALFQPFVSQFATAYLAVEPWKGARTTLGEYLVVHGLFLFVVTTFLITQVFDDKRARGSWRFVRLLIARRAKFERALALHRLFAAPIQTRDDLTGVGVGIAIVFELMLILMQLFVFAFVFPLVALAAGLLLRPAQRLDPVRRLLALLIIAALMMTLMVEVITYKGDIGRMNTVFKFYLQVWVFLAIASAVGIAFFARRVWRSVFAYGWFGVFGVLLFVGLLYPITAATAKVNDRFTPDAPPGLNGMDYMKTAIYHDNNRPLPLMFDRDAILWMRENIPGSPVVLEGNAPLYHWGSRVSIYTGLPTIIGWDWHQKQQRSIVDGGVIDRRIDAARAIYNTHDATAALAGLARFRAQYIYVGGMERAFYDLVGLAKFDAMVKAGQLDLVYENEQVKIYKIKK
ncbi:MAG: glycosyltransferase family 39 protein [Chloroflexi bacterium]|nr:glycosyltransferase family 39 protein [Chloroflexota bacterium]